MAHYEKIPFVWDEPQPRVRVPDRLRFRTLPEVGDELFAAVVAQTLAHSLDRADQQRVAQHGAAQAAAVFIADAANDFDYQPAWWQLAYAHDGSPVGFIQPVIYRGCGKAGLEEATLYSIGVLPEQRGQRYSYDLLCQTTALLQDVGVWRIFCDTDVQNRPMISAFRAVGYVQHGPPRQRPL